MIAWDQVDEDISDKERVVLLVEASVSLLIKVNSLTARLITFVASGMLYFILSSSYHTLLHHSPLESCTH